jgi:hypothetical protein
VNTFAVRAKDFHDWEDFWYGQVVGAGGFETQGLTVHRIEHNTKLASFESNLLDLNRGPKKEDKTVHGVSLPPVTLFHVYLLTLCTAPWTRTVQTLHLRA